MHFDRKAELGRQDVLGSQPPVESRTARLQLRSLPGLKAQLAAVAPGSPAGPGGQMAAAQRGIESSSAQLPHADAIQSSFGHHDIGHVQFHQGAAAAQSTADLGAKAFASGNHVVSGGASDLHTMAHEAAHVVQQRGGVQLKGGIGRAGDRYERHADAVADAVVQGKSAQGLLDEMSGGPTTGAGASGIQAVQLTPLSIALPDMAEPETGKKVFTGAPEYIEGDLDGVSVRLLAGQDFLNTEKSSEYKGDKSKIKGGQVVLMKPGAQGIGADEEDVKVVADGHHRFVWGAFHGESIDVKVRGFPCMSKQSFANLTYKSR